MKLPTKNQSLTFTFLDEKLILSQNELKLLSLMNINYEYSRSELEKELNLSKDLTIKALNSLIDKKLIRKEGSGSKIIYIKKIIKTLF